ncbi:MAG: hypothetical protein GQ574_14455 [Crocinitomix sp.]|nr:hypothetical protein [Crocinitomix sp.]
MRIFERHFFLILLLFLFACTAQKTEVNEVPVVTVADTVVTELEPSTEKEYLDREELYNFTKESPILAFIKNYPPPFDTLDFNKVIAYDFDGLDEHYSTVYDPNKLGYAPVIIEQRSLTIESVDELISLLTDNSTYGGRRAACYEPHLSFIFYKEQAVRGVVDICLDCNFLKSTLPFSNEGLKTITFDSGGSLPLDGFSEKGVDRIIALSTRLNLDYSTFEK